MSILQAVARPNRLAPYPQVLEHDVFIPTLDPRHDGVRIAHLSDVHVGRMTPEGHVRHAVELANRAGADLIALTGDYVNWSRREIPLMEEQLAGLRATRVMVTLGNHDYFTSARRIAEAMRRNGYDVLRNQHSRVMVNGAPLHIVGIDDPVTRHHDVDASFAGVPEGGTRVVLCHCPEQADTIIERGAHLVLSGHTHGGQIYFHGITDRVIRRMGRRYRAGFYKVEDGWLYVSAGVGFSGIRVRVGNGTRAEVGVFTLRRGMPDEMIAA